MKPTLSHYEVFAGDRKKASVMHKPQSSKQPFLFKGDAVKGAYKVVVVDKAGNQAESESFQV